MSNDAGASPLAPLTGCYARLLDRENLLAAALRLSQKQAADLNPFGKGVGGGFDLRLNEEGLSPFAQAHPLQRVIELRNLEVRSALERIGARLPGPVFTAHFPLDSGLSSGKALHCAPHGFVVLVDGHSLTLLAETMRHLCHLFIQPARTSAGKLIGHLGALLRDHLQQVAEHDRTGVSHVSFAPTRGAAVWGMDDGGYGDFLREQSGDTDAHGELAAEAADTCLRFVIAHEYGHLLDRAERGSAAQGEGAEHAADCWAARVLLEDMRATCTSLRDAAPPGPGPRAGLRGGQFAHVGPLLAPAALTLAIAVQRARAVVERGVEQQRGVSLAIQRHQAVATTLAQAAVWQPDELTLAEAFDQSLRNALGSALALIAAGDGEPHHLGVV